MEVSVRVKYGGGRKDRLTTKDVMNLEDALLSFVDAHKREEIKQDVCKDGYAEHISSLSGYKVVLKKAGTKQKRKGYAPLRVELKGRKSTAQIRVAAVERLMCDDAQYRTVCFVEVDGIEYKVKMSHGDNKKGNRRRRHRGVTVANALVTSKIVDKKVV